jgi:hypothetical protein
MVNIDFVFHLNGEPLASEALEENYELAMLFEHTQTQVRHQVEDKLGALRCPNHDQPPRVTVTLVHSEDEGQTDLLYHIDTCCQPFLLDAVRRLNR